ncbi:methyltransferase domain-containing protein [Streptomyces microflavus]|uniref:methyltransferase domain-containing protein n=1 Tax=Streptomyces microflavus TaxID=1919 RepID=UPI00331E5320
MPRVQRHRFLPEQVWIDDDRADGGYRSVDRRTDPDLWWNSAYGNVAVVTQVEDGLPHRLDPHWITPTSSASLPSAVAQMAAAAELAPGLKVLEIGAATGYNLALISEIVGQDHAVGVEIDPALATSARAALDAAGYQKATVVTGDGQQGYVPGAPYDRIVSTAAVMSVPLPWVNQTRPGGMILTPFATTLCGQGMVRLRVDGGQAVGPFVLPLEFMLVRGQRRAARFDELFTDEAWAASRVHLLAADPAFLDDRDALFALGLQLPGVHLGTKADGRWMSSKDSWAYIDSAHVFQWGTRDLFDEAVALHDRWQKQGAPGMLRYGLTVGVAGQHPWLDTPDNFIPVRTRSAAATDTRRR